MASADQEGLAAALAQLARLSVDSESLEARLGRVAELACVTLSDCDMAAMTLVRAGRPSTAVCTDEVTREIDQAQYDADTGPCLDAFRQQQVFRIPSTRTEERWPDFVAAARGHGILSTLSLPLGTGTPMGALNLYSRREHGFGEQSQAIGATFAEQASMVLANAELYWTARNLADQLQEALSTRGVIEQAKGIIMAGRGCDADGAFELLREASQASNKKLHDVAKEVVDVARRRRSAPA
jgi:GAF domain-containing protein